jgi:hypothetical protein
VKCAVDTMLLIWYFDRRPAGANDKLDEYRYRTRVLFTMLEEAKAEILIPVVSIAELLVPMPDAERESFLAEAHRNFFCPAFDIKAAAIAARLASSHQTFSAEDRYEKRTTLKADVQIIASAKAAGAVEFYTHDRKARNLASTIMVAKDLPTKHPNFVVDQELRGLALPEAKKAK